MHSKGIYENQRRTTQDKRVVNLTRSSFAGQQKYATITWSGDLEAKWDVFRNQIQAGLNFCMSGLPYWTTDIGALFVQSANVGSLGKDLWGRDADFDGGLADDNYKELYVRWFQYGAFCPVFRAHSTDVPREIWRFGETSHWAYDALLKFDNLRYRLIPYIYSMAWKVTEEDCKLSLLIRTKGWALRLLKIRINSFKIMDQNDCYVSLTCNLLIKSETNSYASMI